MVNYDCVSLYNLGAPSTTWTCDDSGITNSEARSITSDSKPVFTAYPNPTDGRFSIAIESNINADVSSNHQLLISDAMGRTILQKDIAEDTRVLDVDITSFQKGVYYVILQVGDQRVIEKVIKQ